MINQRPLYIFKSLTYKVNFVRGNGYYFSLAVASDFLLDCKGEILYYIDSMKKSMKKKEAVNPFCKPCEFVKECGQPTTITMMICPKKRVVKKDEE